MDWQDKYYELKKEFDELKLKFEKYNTRIEKTEQDTHELEKRKVFWQNQEEKYPGYCVLDWGHEYFGRVKCEAATHVISYRIWSTSTCTTTDTAQIDFHCQACDKRINTSYNRGFAHDYDESHVCRGCLTIYHLTCAHEIKNCLYCKKDINYTQLPEPPSPPSPRKRRGRKFKK